MKFTVVRADILLSPPFLLALLTLLLNDCFLKYVFPNWFTGKLSDFAGLFVFASFLYAFLPVQKALISYATAAAFVWWKSPLSEPFIEFWNSLGFLHIARVIDYSDLLGLSILPIALHHFSTERKPFSSKWLVWPISCVSLVGILGTSVPRSFDARQFRFEEMESPQWEKIQSAIDEIAVQFKLNCLDCDPRDRFRSYAGQRVFLEIQFDDQGNILFVNVSEFDRSTPSGLSDELMAALSSRIRAIAATTTITPHTTPLRASEHFTRRLVIQENDGGYPFSIGCSDQPRLQRTFVKLDDFARANALTSLRRGTENTLYRSYYAGRVIGPSKVSRTTSVEITTTCRIGGWTINAVVVQKIDDRTMDPAKLLMRLKLLLEDATGQQAQLE